MNERIRELYEQARLHAKSIDADIDPKGWMDLYHQKFAELIVRECMGVVSKKCASPTAYYALRDHFGVE